MKLVGTEKKKLNYKENVKRLGVFSSSS